MNKSLYHFGAFFLGLTAACSLFQHIAEFLFGAQLYTEGLFVAWILVAVAVYITGAIVLLKYYHYRQYWPAFYTGILSAMASLGNAAIVVAMLLSKISSSYYLPGAFISLCAGIIYALTLVFSGAGKHPWLKIAGAYMFVINLVLILSVAWTLLYNGAPYSINSVSGKIIQWDTMAGSLIAIPFIMHFLSEIKLLNKENTNGTIKKSTEDILITIKPLALMLTVIIGVMLTSQGYSSIYWGKKNFENTKALARLFEARSFVNNKGDTLRYRLLKPLNYDPKKRYPLVVSLPYGGQPGTDTIRQLEGAAAAEILSADSNRRKYQAFIFVPNCPAGSGWGGIPNYPSVDTLVYKAIAALDTSFSIDAKRRYVTGISRGGYGSWHFICTRPDMFAAAIPVCGGEDPKLAPRLVNVAVWAFHGAKDQNVPVAGSRHMIEAMRKSGLKPKYTEYPGEGHNIWYQVSITPGLWDWLFAQKRS